MTSSNYEILQQKIKEFVKKYYLNKLYKGIVFFVIILLSVFIIFSLFEYFSYSNTVIRSILFYSFILLFVINLFLYIIIPVFKLCGLGKQIDNEEIARIIGKHFNQIDDKLVNLFELKKQLDSGDYKSYDLLNAAIDNKIENIKPFSFIQAIPFDKTKKYAKYALIPIFIFLLIFIIKNEVFTESTKRIVHHSQIYEKPAPYSFEITNKNLRAFQHEDFLLHFKVSGDEIPDEVFIRYNNRTLKCHKESNSEYSYTFSNVQKDIDFQLLTPEVASENFKVEVLPKPVTLGFTVNLHYPSYLNKPDETLDNVGNLTVPEGTLIQWNFYTKNSDSFVFIYANNKKELTSENDNYVVNIVAKDQFNYSIINKNKYFTSKDTLTDEVNVIKDLYPEIFVQSQQDSAYQERVYFKGNIKDDYGFSKLQFVYSKFDASGKKIESNKTININIQNNVTIQDFYYYFDDNTFHLNPGEKLEYYFQVFDNDGVNGHKSSKTVTSNYRVRTMDEIYDDMHQEEKQIRSDYNDLLKQSSMLKKDFEKLQMEMLQQKEMSWSDKKKLEQLLDKYKDLQKQIQDLQKQQDSQQSMEQQFKDLDDDLIKKQDELQKRMDDVLSNEMKEMINKLQEMMKNADKNKVQQEMKKLKSNSEDLNKVLDQQLQLYKQLEVEKKLNEVVNQLRNLSSELQNSASKTENKNNSTEKLQQKLQQLQSKYNNIQQEIKELKSLNNQLEDPTEFKSTDQLQNEAKQQIQESINNIQKNNRSKSSQNQNKAAEDLDKIAQQMEQDFNESELENVSEDIETIRQILDNLLKTSFDQEDVLNSTSKTKAQSSNVSNILSKQYTVRNNMKLIEDSLSALARRQISVKPFIQTELSKINEYIESSQSNLHDGLMSNAAKNEQFTLTSMNNLALMLKESLKEMQKKKSECNSKCKKQGNGSCSKPGGKGKSKKTSARELQQQLNRQMEAMKRSIEQNNGKVGEQGQKQNMSEQFAKMAAQQEAIRKMLEDYNNAQKNKNGMGDQSLEQIINDMKKTEKELINRTINQQTIQRQQSITTRLLKSERADIEKEKDDERKSNEARQTLRLNPPKDWKFDTEKTQQNEMLRSVPANLNYYYKEKANNYFYNID